MKKTGLKLNIQKTKIMASGPITSWQIEVGKVEVVTDFIFFGSKITTNVDCSHETKILAPWKESYDKLGGGLVAKSSPTLVTPWTVACQAPLSIAFSRQDTRVGCHFLLQGIFLTQGLKPGLLHCR